MKKAEKNNGIIINISTAPEGRAADATRLWGTGLCPCSRRVWAQPNKQAGAERMAYVRTRIHCLHF